LRFISDDSKYEAAFVKKPMGLSVLIGGAAGDVSIATIRTKPQNRNLRQFKPNVPQPFDIKASIMSEG
jgi:hypothetical protein